MGGVARCIDVVGAVNETNNGPGVGASGELKATGGRAQERVGVFVVGGGIACVVADRELVGGGVGVEVIGCG